MRLDEIARLEGKPWVDTAIDLILAERQRVGAIYFMMSEENIRLQLRQPWIKFGTDAGAHDPEKPDGLVHPRSYGTFPRVLGKYVREEGVLTPGGRGPKDDLRHRRPGSRFETAAWSERVSAPTS